MPSEPPRPSRCGRAGVDDDDDEPGWRRWAASSNVIVAPAGRLAAGVTAGAPVEAGAGVRRVVVTSSKEEMPMGGIIDQRSPAGVRIAEAARVADWGSGGKRNSSARGSRRAQLRSE